MVATPCRFAEVADAVIRSVELTVQKLVRRGMAMAKSGVKPLIFLIAVSVMAWVAGMAIHGF